MGKPKMGATIPGFEDNKDSKPWGAGTYQTSSLGGMATPQPEIMKAINEGVGAPGNANAQQQISQQQTPQVNWATPDTSAPIPVSDPNQGFEATLGGANSPGMSPDTYMGPGVPISNTPSTNQENSTGFGLNMPWGSPGGAVPPNANLISALGNYSRNTVPVG